MWSDCLLDLVTDFLVGNMVFVRDVLYLAVAPHFHDSYSSLQLSCEGPWFSSIQEDGCDKAAHQTYFGTERNAPVVPNCFQPCQCCSHLCYPGEYFRFGTLVLALKCPTNECCLCIADLTIIFDGGRKISSIHKHQRLSKLLPEDVKLTSILFCMIFFIRQSRRTLTVCCKLANTDFLFHQKQL